MRHFQRWEGGQGRVERKVRAPLWVWEIKRFPFQLLRGEVNVWRKDGELKFDLGLVVVKRALGWQPKPPREIGKGVLEILGGRTFCVAGEKGGSEKGLWEKGGGIFGPRGGAQGV